MHIYFQTYLIKIFLQGVFGLSKWLCSFSFLMYRTPPQVIFAFFLSNVAPLRLPCTLATIFFTETLSDYAPGGGQLRLLLHTDAPILEDKILNQ
jgi:hypothetical protein